MRFQDPSSVTCPRCSTESAQRVADLLALRATCPKCAANLNDIGLTMRRTLDDWSAFCTWADISIAVEDQLGVSMDDGDVFKEKPRATSLTLEDLANLVRHYLPADAQQAERSRDLVLEAARKVSRCAVEMEAFGLPILQALSPERWNVR